MGNHLRTLHLACSVRVSKPVLRQAVSIIRETYGSLNISCDDYDRIHGLMLHDKNDEKGEINFTLLSDIGQIQINQHVNANLINESLDFYRDSVGL